MFVSVSTVGLRVFEHRTELRAHHVAHPLIGADCCDRARARIQCTTSTLSAPRVYVHPSHREEPLAPARTLARRSGLFRQFTAHFQWWLESGKPDVGEHLGN